MNRYAIDFAQLFERPEIFYSHHPTNLGPWSSPETAALAMFMLLTTAKLAAQRRQVYLTFGQFQ